MTTQTKGRIHLIYGILLSVLILAVGVCFALSCISIYQSGASPFTRESISTHFARIAIPTYICIAGVIGGAVLSLALPVDGVKVKSRRDPEDALHKLSARLDLTTCDESTAASIRMERRWRCRVTVILTVLAGVTLLPALMWCVNPAHFSIENLSEDIKTAALFILPCAAVSLGLLTGERLLRHASVARETATVKAALVAMKGTAKPTEKANPDKKKWSSDPRFVWGVRGAILVVGVVFIVLGVCNGGMADVLGKAIRICTECIGLG
jgi:hypothetical protein